MTVTRSDIVSALRAVGVIPGDVVMFHSSLSSMGHVVGGAKAVIDGFLDAVGPAGTVAVPTLCNWESDEQHLVFARWDVRRSPSFVGHITEALRLRPEAVRSDHATHSVAAIGARAAELIADHGSGGLRPGPFGPAAFARESPWEKLYQWNAAYCFVGVTFHVNTMVHYVETRIVGCALARASADEKAHLASRVRGWMQPGVWPQIRVDDRERIEARLAEQGIVRYGRIGSAVLRCARARPMVDEWLAIIEHEPEKWLPEDFLAWLGEVR